MKKVTNDLKTARKQKDGISQSLPLNNFFKYESLNSQKKTEWLMGLKKQDSTVCCLQETHFSFKDTHRLKVKVWEKILMQVKTTREQGLLY